MYLSTGREYTMHGFRDDFTACSVQSCLTVCNPMDCSPPGSPVRGIFQARMLEWIAISSCRRLSQPRDRNCVSCISCVGRQILYHCTTWEAPEMILDSNLSSTLSAAICIAFSYPNCNSDFQDGLSPPPKKDRPEA